MVVVWHGIGGGTNLYKDHLGDTFAAFLLPVKREIFAENMGQLRGAEASAKAQGLGEQTTKPLASLVDAKTALLGGKLLSLKRHLDHRGQTQSQCRTE
jgi:hypothetical protein